MRMTWVAESEDEATLTDNPKRDSYSSVIEGNACAKFLLKFGGRIIRSRS